MDKYVINWEMLWNELVDLQDNVGNVDQDLDSENRDVIDPWSGQAEKYHQQIIEQWKEPDIARNFLLSQLSREDTFLDIGAGTGAWSLFVSPNVSKVTAIEPSSAMLYVFRKNIKNAGIENINLIKGYWPDADVETHDCIFCSHAVYNCRNIRDYIEKTDTLAKKMNVFLIQAPDPQGIMAEASRKILGYPFDSPCFQVFYNILLEIGIVANVLFEDRISWELQETESCEDAVNQIKYRLGISEKENYDQYLFGLVRKFDKHNNGKLILDEGVQSVVLYWGKKAA